jgi:hypothetical protein
MNKERVVIWEKERQDNTWQHEINLVAYLMTKQQANIYGLVTRTRKRTNSPLIFSNIQPRDELAIRSEASSRLEM